MKKILTILFILFVMAGYSQKRHNYSDNTRQTTGLGIMIGGVGITAATLLEGGSQYGTYVNVTPSLSNNYANTQYVTPPFWRQTPRNIMFCAGVGITITGLITILTK